jgi:hypothetical protein
MSCRDMQLLLPEELFLMGKQSALMKSAACSSTV